VLLGPFAFIGRHSGAEVSSPQPTPIPSIQLGGHSDQLPLGGTAANRDQHRNESAELLSLGNKAPRCYGLDRGAGAFSGGLISKQCLIVTQGPALIIPWSGTTIPSTAGGTKEKGLDGCRSPEAGWRVEDTTPGLVRAGR